MIEEGQEAPEFELPTEEGTLVRLSALRGAPVVLIFYPKDDTRGCTSQVCAVRDAYASFEEHHAHVFGISIDDAQSHRAFRETFSLPFPLLVDDGNVVANLYGIDRMEYQGETLYRRQTVVIDADGIVRRAIAEVDLASHVDDVLAVLG